MNKQKLIVTSIIFGLLFWEGCTSGEATLFSKLPRGKTGIDFRNVLVEDDVMNVTNYIYFYNGGGVAVGDINNDGLQDVFFTGNMVKNRLYLNKGDFEFENITDKSGIAAQQGWCTGATMVDINGDGLLDIYVCRSADVDAERRKNLLFINNGDLTFSEQAAAYGLADPGYSTQASFFDYDKDGDLDMFLINHSLQRYTTGAVENPGWRKERQQAFECKLFQQNAQPGGGHPVFSDVSSFAGISSNVLTFGLGLAVSDINNDGWPDVYVSNDFNEPDYLFVNNGNGTFSEQLSERMDQVSLYSMGSDAADYNNDGLIDLVTMDMLPHDNRTQKMHMGAENFDKFQLLFQLGFYYQYSRNMLHRNNGDGTFSEMGQLAGVSNTDWSWAPLFSDFDNDGNKDLLVSTGYVKDYTDMDFIKYSVDLAVKKKNGEKVTAVRDYISKMPENKLTSSIFKNNGNNSFSLMNEAWGLTYKTVAAGAAYADLDNDGKLDIIINNSNDYASIYKNTGTGIEKNNFLRVKLIGDALNAAGVGAKVKLFAGAQQFYQEQVPVRGYQSSVDPIMHFGIGKIETIDSILVIWPDDHFQVIKNTKANQQLNISKKDSQGIWNYKTPSKNTYFTKEELINVVHRENEFNDFTIQSLLPHYLSRQGPCIAKADVNGDGLEDLFIGGARGQTGQLLLQTQTGAFNRLPQPAFEQDSLSEDVAAVFFDADGDGYVDLLVGSGGYEFAIGDSLLQDRLYLNNGRGGFRKAITSLPPLYTSTGSVKVADIDGDGDIDIFIGARVVPGRYPEAPESAILLNDGRGKFTNATEAAAPALKKLGMVTDAVWADVNKDGQPDLVIVGEWMPIKVFENNRGKLNDVSDKYVKATTTGWWNTIRADDIDHDGDIDFIIGNQGLNNQFHASEKEPLSVVYKDFDGNGSVDPVFCYYINGVSYPAANRDDLLEQLPFLRKKFNSYSSYANATINQVFSGEQLKDAQLLQAVMLESVVLRNNGDSGFVILKLPQEAQISPVYSILCEDINKDGNKDLILMGNNIWTRIKFGRYSANHGTLLLGDANAVFTAVDRPATGLNVRADVRSMEMLQSNKGRMLILGINDGPVQTFLLR